MRMLEQQKESSQCITLQHQVIWKKVINYQNYNYQDWFNHIFNLPNLIDNKEFKNPFNRFSDESRTEIFL